MKRVIKAQLYIKRSITEEEAKVICDKIDLEIEGWPIDYQCLSAEYNGATCTVFNFVTEAHKISDCEVFYRYFKQAIKMSTGKTPYQIFKVKCDRI